MGGQGSGGARVRSGPAREANNLHQGRSTDRNGFIHLPASGRDGDPPVWPMPRPTKFEREMWVREWQRPQAIEWERRGLELQVAIYVRTIGDAIKPGAPVARMAEARKLMDDLGLSVGGLAKNRWIIDDEPQTRAPRRDATSTAKDRIRVLTGGKDARAS